MTKIEQISVPEHVTSRLTVGEWTFTWARTGCLRVQKGDFTAYLQNDDTLELMAFISQYRPTTIIPPSILDVGVELR